MEYSRDDTGNARQFRDLYRGKVRYNFTQQIWMLWDGRIWKPDETAAVKALCDDMLGWHGTPTVWHARP